MPVVSSSKQTFADPFDPQLYGDIVVPEVEWGTIAGVGAPESYANVTGDHIFYQASQPTEADEGDIWFDSDDDNHPYKLVSGVWTSIRDAGAATGLNIGQWVNNLVFAPTDYNTIEWGTGTIKLQDGTTYTIDAGNTGSMAAITYIFLDVSVSLTVLQTTTTATNAVGTNRILVAVAKQNSDTAKDAEFQVFGGFGQNTFITADNIAANTITGNEIVGNTITANKLSVSTLSSIAADLGTITAGSISINGGVASISAAGVGVFTDVQISGLRPGSDINGTYLTANSVASAAANLALRGWTQTCVFTVSDADTVAWGSGTFTASDGTAYSISGGNTGNMAAKTYIYLDIAISTTAYQTTTTAATAIGNGKVLVAIAQNSAYTEATFMLLNNSSYNIDAADIVAGSITANEIAATTITASKMNVSSLSAIAADLGTITAGSISINGGVASINSSGVAVFSDVQITGLRSGSSLDGQYMAAGSVASASVNLALRGWEQTCAFTVSDADTVAWGSGTFTASDGTAYSISGGNTGNMAAKTYIYLDIAISTTAYQTTTTATTAVGNGKVLIAIAQNTAFAEATFFLLNDNSYNIDAANIIAGSITANEIAATTITAGKMNVSQLSAIAADLGTITAGTVTGATLRTAASGARFQMTSSAFEGYNSTGDKVFQVLLSGDTGDVIMGEEASGQYAKWDDSAGSFKVNGSQLTLEDIFGDGSDGDVTISSNTTLTEDMFYNNLTVDSGFVLTTAGFRVFVKGTLTNNGTIRRNGNAGGNGGDATASSGGAIGAAAAALADGSLKGTVASGAGGRGGSSTSSRTDGSNGTSVAKSLGVAGSAGGRGYDPGSAGFVGSASTGGALTGTVYNYPRNAFAAYLLYDTLPSADNLKSSASSGGGGGGDRSGGTAAGGGGGAGGGPGGIVAIYARTLVNSVTGLISANGGVGGDGGDGFSPVGQSAGGGGSGGGGPGGVVLLVYVSYTNSGSVTVTGGATGAVGVGSSAGTPDAARNGEAGTAGTAGVLIELQV